MSVFKEDSLTEDYILGWHIYNLKASSGFIHWYEKNHPHLRTAVATQEYFPNRFFAAIKQRARWNLGIIFQARGLLALNRRDFKAYYFLWRDRRALLSAPTAILSYGISFILLSQMVLKNSFTGSTLLSNEGSSSFREFLSIVFIVLTFVAMIRLIVKMKLVSLYYGWNRAYLVPVRFILLGFLNFFAISRAAMLFLSFKLSKKKLIWQKTAHEMPQELIEVGLNMRRSQAQNRLIHSSLTEPVLSKE
jgi:adsorption protein B